MRPVAAEVSLLMTLLLVVGGSAQAFSAPEPRYTKGDSWTYAINGNITSLWLPPGFPNLRQSGERTIRVTEVTGGNTTTAEVASLKLTASSLLQGTTSNLTVDINTTRTVTSSGSYGAFFVNLSSERGSSSFTEKFRGTFRVNSTVLQNTLVYPLESGHKYRTVARMEVTVDLGPALPSLFAKATTVTEYLARASESVSVKAGTFTTLPLASWTNATEVSIGGLPILPLGSHGNLTQLYYAPDAGNYVKIINYDASGREAVREDLASYNYANAPNRVLQIFSEPAFWGGVIVAGAAAVVVAVVLLGRFRRAAHPSPPSTEAATPGAEGSPPPAPVSQEGPVPEEPAAPGEEGEERRVPGP